MLAEKTKFYITKRMEYYIGKGKSRCSWEIRRRPMLLVGLLLLFIAIIRLWFLLPTLERGFPEEGTCTIYGECIDCEDTISGKRVRVRIFERDPYDLYIYGDEMLSDIFPGNRIRITGTLKLFETATNPGQFDARRFYRLKNIRGRIFADSVCVFDRTWRQPAAMIFMLRRFLKENLLDLCCGKRAEGILTTMLLGDRSGLDPNVKELYREGGIAHILAISGLHISLLGFGLYKLLRRIGLSISVSAAISICFMGAYLLLTGSPPSALRAYIFFVWTIAGQVQGRGRDSLTAYTGSYAIMVTLQPLYLMDAGFHLSFSAVAGVFILVPYVHPVSMKSRYPVPVMPPKNKRQACMRIICKEMRKLVDILEASFLLQLTVLPVMAWYYREMTFYGILLNLLVLPCVGIVMILGITALLFQICGISAGHWILEPVEGILYLFEKGSMLIRSMPGAMWIMGKPAILSMILYYAFFLTALFTIRHVQIEDSDRSGLLKKRKRAASYSLILCAMWILCIHPDNLQFRMSFLDVGQGDCILMHVPQGPNILVDCGSSDARDPEKNRMIPYLKSYGIRKLEYVFLTHTDEDHMNGIEELFTEDRNPGVLVKNLVVTEEAFSSERGIALCSRAGAAGTRIQIMRAGDMLSFRKLSITCLSPEKGSVFEDTDKNDSSLVLHVRYGKFDALLTGDLEEAGEKCMLHNNTYPKDLFSDVEILKAGHHGSRGSSCEEFLHAVKPQYAVISCGKNNRYGHPHEELLERLYTIRCKVLRTDRKGCITIETDGKKMTIRTFL